MDLNVRFQVGVGLKHAAADWALEPPQSKVDITRVPLKIGQLKLNVRK